MTKANRLAIIRAFGIDPDLSFGPETPSTALVDWHAEYDAGAVCLWRRQVRSIVRYEVTIDRDDDGVSVTYGDFETIDAAQRAFGDAVQDLSA